MKKLLFIPLLFISFCLSASPIGEKRAREIAAQFFAQTVTRGADVKLDLEWAGFDINAATTRGAVVDADEALMYIYNRADAKGFVIVSGDDSTRPIIAYSNEGNFEVNDIADATRWMLSSWCDQIEASREANIPPLNGGIIFDDDDDEVEELLYETAKWNQGEPYNRLSPHYVDGKAPSGCVATAICIVMRYHCWPDRGVGTTPAYTINRGEGKQSWDVPANELGQEYKWDKMPLEYIRGEYSTYEGDAVAELMYDVGTAMNMGWAPGGSGAVTGLMIERMAKYFKYTKASRWMNSSSYTEAEWVKLLSQNVRDYGPTVGAGGGHAYVVDGYDKRGYFHLNYGWGGSADGFYYLPDNDFCRSMGAGFYFEPDRDGTSKPRDLCSFVTLGTNRKDPDTLEDRWTCTWWGLETNLTEFKSNTSIPLRQTIGRNSTIGPFTGYVNLVLCDRDGNFIETVQENYYDNIQSGGELWKASDGEKKVTIKSDLKPGYRLRYYFKGGNPGEWEWMRDGSEVFEIVVCASPEEIAENLKLTYDKADKIIYFYSSIALKYEVKDADGNVKTSGATAGGRYFNTELDPEYSIHHERGPKVDMSKYESGEYTISFTCGSDPYVLKVQL